ncbi:hypothetical protein B0H14DRAFT_3151670 [Mycena olivaceomarginata]|nr:hypothetical protein B0H14DRAFT_3151670 [Mycena olivaceomarginata]
MQFISSLIIALLTLAMSTSASPAQGVALTPDSVAAAGLTNVHDFQGNSLNLVGASQTDGTAVILFPSSFDGAINQQERTLLIYWNFTPNGSNFVIANGMNPSLFLSYPGAPFGATPDFAGTVVYSKLPTVFSLQPVPPPLTGVMIVELNSQTVLTAWKVVPGILQTPVTLAPVSPSLQNQQTWTIVTAPLVA